MARLVEMGKVRLGRVLSFVQSQITGKDLNLGLSDTALPWPLHGFLWALQPDVGVADSLSNGTPSLLILHSVAGEITLYLEVGEKCSKTV